MRNSNLYKRVAPTTIKRIYRDLKELEENPLPGISVCMPNPEDPLTLHGNILIMDGPYSDMLIHIIVHLPHDYPIVGPAANIAPGLNFGRRFHHHLFDDLQNGNQICTDLLTNFRFMYDGSKTSGWTPSYTLSTALLHLQVFFANPDLNYPPTEAQIESLRRHVQEFKMPIELPENKFAMHSFETPFPPLPNRRAETAQTIVNKSDVIVTEEKIKEEAREADSRKQAEQWLYCAISKCSIFDESRPVLGYPLDIRKDENGRVWPKPILEMISENSFMQNIARENIFTNFEFCEDVTFKSSFGESYNFWIPVYINEEHYKRCRERILKAIAISCKRCKGTAQKEFTPHMILVVLPVIMLKMIVRVLKNELHQSVAAIQAYWHFYRLLMRLLIEFPEVKDMIHGLVENMMKGNTSSLGKKSIARVGAVEAAHLVLTNISIDEIDARNSILPEPFVKESLKKLEWIQQNAREVSWDEINQNLQLEGRISSERDLVASLIEAFDFYARNSKLKSRRSRQSRSRSASTSVFRSVSHRRRSSSHRRRQISRSHSRRRSSRRTPSRDSPRRHSSRRNRKGSRSRNRSHSRRRSESHRRQDNRERRENNRHDQRYENRS